MPFPQAWLGTLGFSPVFWGPPHQVSMLARPQVLLISSLCLKWPWWLPLFLTASRCLYVTLGVQVDAQRIPMVSVELWPPWSKHKLSFSRTICFSLHFIFINQSNSQHVAASPWCYMFSQAHFCYIPWFLLAISSLSVYLPQCWGFLLIRLGLYHWAVPPIPYWWILGKDSTRESHPQPLTDGF